MATAKFFNPDTEQWEPVAQGMSPNSFVTDETPAGAVDGTNKNFTTAQSYIPGTLEVYINGLRQASGSHVTEISSEAGTFSLDTAPQSGDVLRVAYQHSTAASGNAQTLSGHSASTSPGPGQIPVVDENGALDVDGDIYSNGQKVLTTNQLVYPAFNSLSSTVNFNPGNANRVNILSVDFDIPDYLPNLKVTVGINAYFKASNASFGYHMGVYVNDDDRIIYKTNNTPTNNSPARAGFTYGVMFTPTEAGVHTFTVGLAVAGSTSPNVDIETCWISVEVCQ